MFDHDELGREVAVVNASLEFGTMKTIYKYDEHGNKTSELITSTDFRELIITEYDEHYKPVTRKTYKPKTFANNQATNIVTD